MGFRVFSVNQALEFSVKVFAKVVMQLSEMDVILVILKRTKFQSKLRRNLHVECQKNVGTIIFVYPDNAGNTGGG
jgi:hypothetical protein